MRSRRSDGLCIRQTFDGQPGTLIRYFSAAVWRGVGVGLAQGLPVLKLRIPSDEETNGDAFEILNPTPVNSFREGATGTCLTHFRHILLKWGTRNPLYWGRIEVVGRRD